METQREPRDLFKRPFSRGAFKSLGPQKCARRPTRKLFLLFLGLVYIQYPSSRIYWRPTTHYRTRTCPQNYASQTLHDAVLATKIARLSTRKFAYLSQKDTSPGWLRVEHLSTAAVSQRRTLNRRRGFATKTKFQLRRTAALPAVQHEAQVLPSFHSETSRCLNILHFRSGQELLCLDLWEHCGLGG